MKKNNRGILTFSTAVALLLAATAVTTPAALAAEFTPSVPAGEEALPEELEARLFAKDISGIDLAIPAAFNITRPSEKLTTAYSSYFITGTSDPSQPVYYNGAEISRLGSQGTFGVHVSLNTGANTFTFRQGDETKTVTIVRSGSVGSPAIQEIRQASMYPATSGGVKVGGNLPVECTAPSGATVSATFAGTTVQLTQSKTAGKGVAVTYTGKLPVNTAPVADETTRVGAVTYKMTYNGSSSTYRSTGDVYVAGENSAIAMRVTNYIGFVYPSTSNPARFKEKLKVGATDYVKAENNEYFQLSSGGFMPKTQGEIIAGKVRIKNSLDNVSAKLKSKGETYTFQGSNSPAYVTKYGDGKFIIRMYNTSGAPAPDVSGSKLFSGVAANEADGCVTYTFAVKSASRFWGYNVAFEGGNTVLSFKYKPTLQNGSQPLSGVTILLDPGHGGEESGAYGVAGATGPVEKDVNLANALYVKAALENQGATVLMTRAQDATVTLDDRLKAIEETDADLFLAIHHNSLLENVDANKVSGMEVYYHTGLSSATAKSMMSGLSNGLNRNNRFVQQSYYRVTLMPGSPALLLELGYMSNPLEYEKAASTAEMEKVGAAVANGVTLALR